MAEKNTRGWCNHGFDNDAALDGPDGHLDVENWSLRSDILEESSSENTRNDNFYPTSSGRSSSNDSFPGEPRCGRVRRRNSGQGQSLHISERPGTEEDAYRNPTRWSGTVHTPSPNPGESGMHIYPSPSQRDHGLQGGFLRDHLARSNQTGYRPDEYIGGLRRSYPRSYGSAYYGRTQTDGQDHGRNTMHSFRQAGNGESTHQGQNSTDDTPAHQSKETERVDLHTTSSERRNTTPRCRCKKAFTWCIIVALVITSCVSLVVWFMTPASSENLTATKAYLAMRVDDKFNEQMAHASSEIFIHYGSKFCFNVEKATKDTMTMESCLVTQLWKGSINVKCLILVVTSSRYTDKELALIFGNTGAGNDYHTHFGLITAFTDSITVDILDTRTVSSKGSEKLPQGFACSESEEYYLPVPYTYPYFCGEYQLCKGGEGILHSCEKGLEFGYSMGSTQAPCHTPSNFTYCGVQRMNARATSLGTTSTTTSAEATTGLTTIVSMTTETLAEISCSSIDSRIMLNSSSLYNCPKSDTNGSTYLPRPDTFPDNCTAYTWCDGAMKLDGDFHCAVGSSFILKEEPCEIQGDNSTFCEQMKQAEMCREHGWTLADRRTTPIPGVSTP